LSVVDPLILAVPLFLLLMAAEAVVLARRGDRTYRLNDFASAISCALLDQLGILTLGALYLGVYAHVQQRFGLIHVSPRSPLAWIACVIAHDVAYYAYHRASHRVNVLWAAHAVHHQSEEYNFTVSFRQGTVATVVTYAFYAPLALAGFPVRMFLIVHGVYQVYQFFVHTRLVPRLGPLELVLATPSHHRVHHGKDAGFLDKNYGGFTILLDRVLGTFAEETHEPSYGVPRGIRSWSPLWANLRPFGELWERSRKAPSWSAAITVWFAPPERAFPWEEPTRETSGYDATAPVELAGYLVVQLVLASLVTMGLGYFSGGMPPWIMRGCMAFVCAGLLSVMSFFDGKKHALWLERARLVFGFIGFAAAALMWKSGVAAALTLACAASFAMLQGSLPQKPAKR
jgi:sterol desaturase/sphingolipid hydroxylase (fatty acid hydroxylase superfamily)